MPEPLTEHERFNIKTCPLTGREKELVDAYEATVRRLEATVAALAPLAATGEAVEGMEPGDGLYHAHNDKWLSFGVGALYAEAAMFCGVEAEDDTALAALAAAKGAIPDQS